MKVNRVEALLKLYDYSGLKEEYDYKKSKQRSKDEQLSFSEILRKEKEIYRHKDVFKGYQ